MLYKPDSKNIILWEFFILFATILATIVSPLIVVFNIPIRGGIQIFDVIITIVFAIDIYLNFNTAYEEKRVFVTDRKLINRRYLKGWFLPDILATIPFSLIFFSVHGMFLTRLFRFFRLTRLFKLLSASKTLKKTNELSSSINPSFIRMILLMFWVIIASHLISMGWVALGGISHDLPQTEQYMKSLYWTITTLTTIGYGDISPTAVAYNKYLFIYTMIIQLLGAGMYGFIIGNISNLIANMDIAKSQHQEKIERINNFLKYKNIDGNLQKRVNNYFDYTWETRRGYNESSVINELPVSLKTMVSLQMNRDIIEKVPLFNGASEAFLKEIILNLEPVVFTPGDYIITAGEIGYEMFFISNGSVDVLSADEKITFVTLSEGSFVGEIALILNTPRTATVKAVDYCDLYMLHKKTFDSILAKYSSFARQVAELAEKRKAELDAASGIDVKEKEDNSDATELLNTEIIGLEVENPYELMFPGNIYSMNFKPSEDKKLIDIDWIKLPNTDHYQLIKKDMETANWNILESRLDKNEYTDLKPEVDKKNIYRIRAVNRNGSAEWSSAFYYSFTEGKGEL